MQNNPASRFYERMGGVRLTSAEIEVGGKLLAEKAYGWDERAMAAFLVEPEDVRWDARLIAR